METREKNDPFHDLEQHDAHRRKRAADTFWVLFGTLLKKRRFIVGVTVVMAVVSVAGSLMLPKWYQASTRLLAPEATGASPISAALARNLSAAASAFIGAGGGGDFERYISIMSSRTVSERVIERFNLLEVYETTESISPMEDARKQLSDNVTFSIDLEYGYLSVSVLDQDPQRAADMANFLVDELNRVNMTLSAQDASNYRVYVEKRYNETLARLDSLKREAQAFQEEYGVFDMQTQATAFLEQLAAIRTEELMLDIQYEALLNQYGPENPQVSLVRNSLRAAQRKREEALAGSEQILPVPQPDVPAVMRRYLELEQESYIQRSILEVVAPLYDQARFQEEREFTSVQIVDSAVPPIRKAKPKRSVIVIAATMSAFVLACLYVLGLWAWTHYAPILATRIRTSMAGSDDL